MLGFGLQAIVNNFVAGLILAFNMLVENVVIIPLVLVIMELGKPKREGRLRGQFAKVLLGVVKRPLVIGIALGLVVSLAGITLPGPVERLVSLVSASAAALEARLDELG